jgi:hypothetical protein
MTNEEATIRFLKMRSDDGTNTSAFMGPDGIMGCEAMLEQVEKRTLIGRKIVKQFTDRMRSHGIDIASIKTEHFDRGN